MNAVEWLSFEAPLLLLMPMYNADTISPTFLVQRTISSLVKKYLDADRVFISENMLIAASSQLYKMLSLYGSTFLSEAITVGIVSSMSVTNHCFACTGREVSLHGRNSCGGRRLSFRGHGALDLPSYRWSSFPLSAHHPHRVSIGSNQYCHYLSWGICTFRGPTAWHFGHELLERTQLPETIELLPLGALQQAEHNMK